MQPDLTILLAIGALAFSALGLLTRAFDKNLSIREYETYRKSVQNDIERLERRLGHLEQTRPTTGELQILADGINKRIDEMRKLGPH